MAQQTINIGTVANDGTGDLVRNAFSKANDNYNELYAALNPTKGLFKWGRGADWSALGIDPLTVVSSDNDWDSVSLGETFGLAIKAGKLYSWGANASGKTGQSTTAGNTYIPTQVGVETDWWMISAGNNHSLGIRKTFNVDHYDYTLWVWGEGGSYALGTGTTTDLTSPTQIGSDVDWQWISGGSNWSCAVKNGLLYTCGGNASYKTGQNTTTGSTTTWTNYDVGSTGWTKCFAGAAHGIGIRTGELWAWGESNNYQTGMNSTTDLSIPTQVGVLTNWASGSAGNLHSGAINSSGQLFMFGEGLNGRLGNGGTTDYTTPTQIGTDTDWENVNCNGGSTTVGYNEFTYAIKGGKLYATGLNSLGQCGQPISTSEFNTFQQIGNGTNYIEVSSGGGFGMAIQQSVATTTTTT